MPQGLKCRKGHPECRKGHPECRKGHPEGRKGHLDIQCVIGFHWFCDVLYVMVAKSKCRKGHLKCRKGRLRCNKGHLCQNAARDTWNAARDTWRGKPQGHQTCHKGHPRRAQKLLSEEASNVQEWPEASNGCQEWPGMAWKIDAREEMPHAVK